MSCNKCMKRRTFLSMVVGLPTTIAAMISGLWISRSYGNALFKAPPRAPIGAKTLKDLKPGEPKHFPKSGAWVVLQKDNSMVAFDQRCAHKGCVYDWSVKNNRFECPCHGSAYDIKGNVVNGPASKPLKKLRIQRTVSGDIHLHGV